MRWLTAITAGNDSEEWPCTIENVENSGVRDECDRTPRSQPATIYPQRYSPTLSNHAALYGGPSVIRRTQRGGIVGFTNEKHGEQQVRL